MRCDSKNWAVKGMGEPDPSLPKGRLCNLAKDRGEMDNLYEDHPEIVRWLINLLIEYRAHRRS